MRNALASTAVLLAILLPAAALAQSADASVISKFKEKDPGMAKVFTR